MDKKSLAIVTLALSNVDYDAYGSHMASMIKTGKLFPDWDIVFLTPGRMAIDVARNACVQQAKLKKCDYIFFIDDDTFITPEALGVMLSKMVKDDTIDVLQPIYFIRGDGFPPMVFKPCEKKGFRKLDDADWVGKKGLVPVAATGNGCTLYRMSMFDKIPHPWFKTKPGQYTEDVYFYSKAQHFYPEYKAYMDMSVTCGHIVDKIVVDATNFRTVRAWYQLLGTDEPLRAEIIDYIEDKTKHVKDQIEAQNQKHFDQSAEFFNKGEKNG